MTVLLVNTPFLKLYYGPTIALPTLAGYVQSQGTSCEQFDASIALLKRLERGVIAEARRQQVDASQVTQAIVNLLHRLVLRRSPRLDVLLKA